MSSRYDGAPANGNSEIGNSNSPTRAAMSAVDIIAQMTAMLFAGVNPLTVGTYGFLSLDANWKTRKGATATPAQIAQVTGKNAKVIQRHIGAAVDLGLIDRNTHHTGTRRAPSTFDLRPVPRYSRSTLQAAIGNFVGRVKGTAAIPLHKTLGQDENLLGKGLQEGDTAVRVDRGEVLSERTQNIDIREIRRAAAANVERLCRAWLPDGKVDDQDWLALNPTRPDRHLGSFRIDLRTGRFHDFANGDHGPDLIALRRYIDGQPDTIEATIAAARIVMSDLGGAESLKPGKSSLRKKGQIWTYKPLRPLDLPLFAEWWTPGVGDAASYTLLLRRYIDASDPRGKAYQRGYRLPDGQIGKGMPPVWKPCPYRHEFMPRLGTIFVAEGETAADAAASLQLPCVSVTDGEQEACVPFFQRHSVIILPDHDPAGRRRATRMRAALEVAGIEAEIPDLSSVFAMEPGDDIADLVASGVGQADLLNALKQARPLA